MFLYIFTSKVVNKAFIRILRDQTQARKRRRRFFAISVQIKKNAKVSKIKENNTQKLYTTYFDIAMSLYVLIVTCKSNLRNTF